MGELANRVMKAARSTELGRMRCMVCDEEITVFLAKNDRPYSSCINCLTRTYYNGVIAIESLKQRLVVQSRG